jgi:putative endonuclease
MKKGGYVYLVTNAHHNVVYVGMTSELLNRIYQHRTHFYKKSFSARYNIEYLVYYEHLGNITDAIAREKEIKKWRREKKDALINSMNPEWRDLWDEMA